MAPRKRRAGEEAVNKGESASSRLTRSSTRRAANGSSDLARPEKTKKAKRGSEKAENATILKPEDANEEEKEEVTESATELSSKTVIVEHCKQCNSFKTRAIKVKENLERGLSGVTVLLNPEKPRRGCFEIREEGGEKFISLLDMKRPFLPMKALDMDKVIGDIIDKLK